MNSRLDWLVLSDYYSIYVTNAPPLGNNTNPNEKLEFVLFFSNEYFGIKRALSVAIKSSLSKICSSETVEFLHPRAAREKYASTEKLFQFFDMFFCL